MHDHTINAATRTTEAGALTGLIGWASQVNWIGWLGLGIALAGYLTNLYYQRKKFRLEKAEHDARMLALKDRCEP